MLSKLRLDQTKKYELAIATKRVAEMLVAYIEGRAHDLRLGSEQGGIKKWDDFVIEKADRTYEHIQVKRQNTDFSDAPCERDYVEHRNGTKSLQELSPFDEALSALATWTQHNDPKTAVPKRTFLLVVPNLVTKIKKGLDLRTLHACCHMHIKPATDVAGLELLVKDDPATYNLFAWLKSWCGFTDTAHILKSLRMLTIWEAHQEPDIKEDTIAILNRCFGNYNIALEKIGVFLDENSSYTSAVSPRPLLEILSPFMLPGIQTWTQYSKMGNDWIVSGTHDLSFTSIESPERVVKALWKPQNSILRINGSITANDQISKTITRLALHVEQHATGQIQELGRWHEMAKHRVGYTLGVSEEDCSLDNLKLLDCHETYSCSDSRILPLSEQDPEANALTEAMYSLTWEKVALLIDQKIGGMENTDLRLAINERWKLWKTQLSSQLPEQIAIFNSMLHPECEGADIAGELRVGKKTTGLLRDGLFLLLVVAVALSENDSGWKFLNGTLATQTLALQYWSGPMGKERKPRRLTDPGISELLGKEHGKILILSKVEASSTEIFEATMADEPIQQSSMASPHKPLLLITHTIKLRRFIDQGDLTALRSYLQGELKRGQIPLTI